MAEPLTPQQLAAQQDALMQNMGNLNYVSSTGPYAPLGTYYNPPLQQASVVNPADYVSPGTFYSPPIQSLNFGPNGLIAPTTAGGTAISSGAGATSGGMIANPNYDPGMAALGVAGYSQWIPAPVTLQGGVSMNVGSQTPTTIQGGVSQYQPTNYGTATDGGAAAAQQAAQMAAAATQPSGGSAGGFIPGGIGPDATYKQGTTTGVGAMGQLTQPGTGYYQSPSTSTIGSASPGSIGAFNPAGAQGVDANTLAGYNQTIQQQNAAAQQAALTQQQQQAALTASAAQQGMDAYYAQYGMIPNPNGLGGYIPKPATTTTPTLQGGVSQTQTQTGGTTTTQTPTGGSTTVNVNLPQEPQQLTPQQQAQKSIIDGLLGAMGTSNKHTPTQLSHPSLPNAQTQFGAMPGATGFNGIPLNQIAQGPDGPDKANTISDAYTPPAQQAMQPNTPQAQPRGQFGLAQPGQSQPGSPGYNPNNPNNQMSRNYEELFAEQKAAASPSRMYAMPQPPGSGPQSFAQKVFRASMSPSQRAAEMNQYHAILQAVTQNNKAVQERQERARQEQRMILGDQATFNSKAQSQTFDAEQKARDRNELTDNDVREATKDVFENFPQKGEEQTNALVRLADSLEAQGRKINGQDPLPALLKLRGDYPNLQNKLRAANSLEAVRQQTYEQKKGLYELKKAQAEANLAAALTRNNDHDIIFNNKTALDKITAENKAMDLQLKKQTYNFNDRFKTQQAVNQLVEQKTKGIAQEAQLKNSLRVSAGQAVDRFGRIMQQLMVTPGFAGEDAEPKRREYLQRMYESKPGANDGLAPDGLPKAVHTAQDALKQFPEDIKNLQVQLGSALYQARAYESQMLQVMQENGENVGLVPSKNLINPTAPQSSKPGSLPPPPNIPGVIPQAGKPDSGIKSPMPKQASFAAPPKPVDLQAMFKKNLGISLEQARAIKNPPDNVKRALEIYDQNLPSVGKIKAAIPKEETTKIATFDSVIDMIMDAKPAKSKDQPIKIKIPIKPPTKRSVTA